MSASCCHLKHGRVPIGWCIGASLAQPRVTRHKHALSASQSATATVHLQQQDPQQLQQQGSPAPSVFRFRHFTLLHGGPCAMKMGTDAMLLGAWAQPPPGTRSVLDVGTGSGVLALMMAQKTQQQAARVHAIDIDAAAVAQACQNAAASPWSHQLLVAQSSVQAWADQCGQRYDVIVTNPPYFLRSSKPNAVQRAAARHADGTLPFDELAACAAQLLSPAGRMFVILPAVEAGQFVEAAAAAGLQLTRLTQVYTKNTDAQPKRHLMQFETCAALSSNLYASLSAPDASSTCSTCSSSSSSLSGSEQQPHGASSLAVEQLVVMEQCQAAGRPSNNPQHSSSSKAAWGFTDQYKQLTVDFHHPDML